MELLYETYSRVRWNGWTLIEYGLAFDSTHKVNGLCTIDVNIYRIITRLKYKYDAKLFSNQ